MRRPVMVVAMVAALTASLTSCSNRVEVGAWWIDPLVAGKVIAPGSTTKVADMTGNGHSLSSHSSSNASISVVDTGNSVALRFPSTGTAALVVAGPASFNPGSANFEVSASVAITPSDAGSTGANIIQKG